MATGDRWQHQVRGTTYTELGRGEMQISSKLRIIEGAAVIVYVGSDGRLWVRPEQEFEDGRFRRVSGGTPEARPGVRYVARWLLYHAQLSFTRS